MSRGPWKENKKKKKGKEGRKEDIEFEKEGEENKEKPLKGVLIVCIWGHEKLAVCIGRKSIMIACPRRDVLQDT